MKSSAINGQIILAAILSLLSGACYGWRTCGLVLGCWAIFLLLSAVTQLWGESKNHQRAARIPQNLSWGQREAYGPKSAAGTEN